MNVPGVRLSTLEYNVKKVIVFPSPAVMALAKLCLAGTNLVFPARESLDSDIPAGDGKNDTFLQVSTFF
jgi:hypothetical protein